MAGSSRCRVERGIAERDLGDIGDHRDQALRERREVALRGAIERRGIEHHQARAGFRLQPVPAEHAHHESRRTRHQQRHGKPLEIRAENPAAAP